MNIVNTIDNLQRATAEAAEYITRLEQERNQLVQELAAAKFAYESLHVCLSEYGVVLAEARGLGPTL